jgi:hypothetical protein
MVNGLKACAMVRELVHLLTAMNTLVNGKILQLPEVGITGRMEIKHGLIWMKIGNGYTKTQNKSSLNIGISTPMILAVSLNQNVQVQAV